MRIAAFITLLLVLGVPALMALSCTRPRPSHYDEGSEPCESGRRCRTFRGETRPSLFACDGNTWVRVGDIPCPGTCVDDRAGHAYCGRAAADGGAP